VLFALWRDEMKHQIHLGTESGIVSKEASKKIRLLLTDLTRTLQMLDAEIAAQEKRPRAEDLVLDERRHNLLVTIASMEDRLASIEHIRAREYRRTHSSLPNAPTAPLH
jgi:hypothetical protein